MPVISIRDYARSYGVTPAAIHLAINAGLIQRRGRGLIDREQADSAWGRRHAWNAAARQQTAASEARREQAILTSTVAKVQMTAGGSSNCARGWSSATRRRRRSAVWSRAWTPS